MSPFSCATTAPHQRWPPDGRSGERLSVSSVIGSTFSSHPQSRSPGWRLAGGSSRGPSAALQVQLARLALDEHKRPSTGRSRRRGKLLARTQRKPRRAHELLPARPSALHRPRRVPVARRFLAAVQHADGGRRLGFHRTGRHWVHPPRCWLPPAAAVAATLRRRAAHARGRGNERRTRCGCRPRRVELHRALRGVDGVARAERERFAPSRRTTRPRASSGERCEARWQRPAGTLRCGRAARAKQGGALQGGAAGWPLGGAVPRNKRHAREAWNRIQQKGHIAVALPPASTWLSHGLTTSLVADHCRRVRGDKTLRVLLPAQHRNISNG